MLNLNNGKFKISVNENYELLGTRAKLNKSKIYLAEFARNIPQWEENESIWVNCGVDCDILLHKGEYTKCVDISTNKLYRHS